MASINPRIPSWIKSSNSICLLDFSYLLAIFTIKTSNIKIISAKSALISATSAFKTISKKYDAGIVDNVVYLDALSSKTSAKALYETSLNDLEIAYASYYYYAGKNIEEFLKWEK